MNSKQRAQKDHADVVNMMNRTRQNRQGGGLLGALGCGLVLLMVIGFTSGLVEIVQHFV